jgi:hypothetical protein
MCDVFGTTNDTFAVIDPLQPKNWNPAQTNPIQVTDGMEFRVEILQSRNGVEKIYNQIVLEHKDGIGAHGCAQFKTEIGRAHVLSRREVKPDVRIEGDNRRALDDGRRHSHDYMPNLFLTEGEDKTSERRTLLWICHRWVGVAAKLRANRICSCSSKPGTFLISDKMRSNFLPMVFDLP